MINVPQFCMKPFMTQKKTIYLNGNKHLVGNISYEDDGFKCSMTIPELKNLLRTKGLKVGGIKEVLVARLLEEAS